MLIAALLGCPADLPSETTVTVSTPTPPPVTTPPLTTPPVVDTGTTTTDAALTVGALRFTDGVRPTNLLVVSVDTTRRDYIGRFSGNGLTPELDAVLASGVVLEDHRSCSNWTAPSMTCVVSGRTQMHFDFGTWNSDPAVPNVPPPRFEHATLPAHLGGQGYRSVLVTANSVFSTATGVGAGFDRQVDADYWMAADVADLAMIEATDLISGVDPWYLHVHFMDPHGNYCAPESYVDTTALEPVGISANDWCYDSYGPGGSWGYASPTVQQALLTAYLALYEGEMAYWDTEFGAFWDRLDNAGALDDTLVMFVTDHGQQFFERGGHGHGLYLGNEENRSTAAFWARNLEAAVWTDPTLHQDLTATLFELYGIKPVEPLVGLTVGTAPTDRAIRTINYWGGSSVDLGVVHQGNQLLYNWYGDRAFYDLATDPAGLTDVYSPTDPDVIAAWSEMDAWIAEVAGIWTHLPPPVAAGP